jgi:type VI secretion system Hcp family effector
MSLRRFISTLCLGMFTLAVAPSARADIFVTIAGAKQGQFPGDSLDAQHKNASVVTSFEQDAKVPRDASGVATGKRQLSPVVFKKNASRSSVHLFQALVNNEVLTSVVFEFTAPDATGVVKTVKKVTLTNAVLSDIHQRASAAKSTWIDEVSVAFQKIEILDVPTGTVASDSLTGPL